MNPRNMTSEPAHRTYEEVAKEVIQFLGFDIHDSYNLRNAKELANQLRDNWIIWSRNDETG